MTTLITIIKYVLVYLVGHLTGDYLIMFALVQKHAKEKHICNHCQVGFLSSPEQLNYIYCPYCGRPLDYHEYDERSKNYKGEEQ